MSTDIAHQYRTIASRAGWIRRDSRGFVRVDGPDRLTFLHALFTNDLLSLAPRHGVAAAYLTPQGRMLASLDVLNRDDHVLLLVDGSAAALAIRLDSLIFAEQVSVADVSGEWSEIDVIGAGAAEVVADVFGAAAAVLRASAELEQVDLASGFVMRGGESVLQHFRVVLPANESSGVVSALANRDIPEIDPSLATALRIEAGRAAWGQDLFEDTIPLEAGLLDRAISTTKGCYVGQEVVIRILHRGGGRVAKRLVQLTFLAGSREVPQSGAPLAHGAEVVGRITSAAFSPARDAVIALGYVHRDVAEVGKVVAVSDGSSSATVTALAA